MTASDAGYLVCARYTPGDPILFADNLYGVCSRCKHAIMWRPYAPQHLPRICVQCIVAMQAALHPAPGTLQ